MAITSPSPFRGTKTKRVFFFDVRIERVVLLVVSSDYYFMFIMVDIKSA